MPGERRIQHIQTGLRGAPMRCDRFTCRTRSGLALLLALAVIFPGASASARAVARPSAVFKLVLIPGTASPGEPIELYAQLGQDGKSRAVGVQVRTGTRWRTLASARSDASGR